MHFPFTGYFFFPGYTAGEANSGAKKPFVATGHLGSLIQMSVANQDPKPGVIRKIVPTESESNPFKAYIQDEESQGEKLGKTNSKSVTEEVKTGYVHVTTSKTEEVKNVSNGINKTQPEQSFTSESQSSDLSSNVSQFKYSGHPSKDIEITKPTAVKLKRNPAIKVNRSSTFSSPLNRPSVESVRLIPGRRQMEKKDYSEMEEKVLEDLVSYSLEYIRVD